VVDELDANGMSEADERRLFDRSRLIVDVFFDGRDATGVASTKDISLGGLYMNTQATLPEGALLTLRIPLSGDQQVVVNAEVVYSNPGRGVGVRFHGLKEEDRELMQRELPTP
jgi:PilZ domain